MTVRFVVEGVVQGVGYRYFVARRAGALALSGWARNLSDGRVEVVVQGTQAAIDSLEVELKRGPSRSRVTSLDRTEVSDEIVRLKAFEIK